MGKRAARFVQGRLLMHGADPATPVGIVENASRADERVISTTLAALPDALNAANLNGPAVIMLGLAQRARAVEKRGDRVMPRPFSPQVVTANALIEGDPIWLTEDDTWSRRHRRCGVDRR